MLNKVLVVVDTQNDFIDGSLRNEAAINTVPNIVNYIKQFDGKVIFTQDTHKEDYLSNTLEGKKLPVKHCIEGEDGWKLNDQILTAALCKDKADTFTIKKNTFGSTQLPVKITSMFDSNNDGYDIYICGFCTDICVVSNAIILRAAFPNDKITVIKNCCAGTSEQAHEAALTVMQSCQIEIV